MKYGLIAEHLGHSFSKEIHARLADYEYEMCELTPDELDKFMRSRDFSAINVTIPYKEAVMPYLDHIDENALAVGSVNTIVNRDGILYGYNTDVFGMTALVSHMGLEISGKKVLIAGTGGTSKTSLAVAKALGASEVYRMSRTCREDSLSYGEAYTSHADAEVIINTTPVGMFPNDEDTPIDLSKFPKLCGVIDAIYNPLRTNLILDAKSRGIAAEGGLYMLVAQAVAAVEIFLNKKLPAEVTEKVYLDILREKENIVLIGMPGCGKSTIGSRLAEQTGRKFYDLDEEIVKFTGREIPEIFKAEGEKVFRDIESEVLMKNLAQIGGSVIATGGGAILRPENVKRLRRNGRLYFLNRPLSQLLPTPDRPLASSAEAIEARYRERLPKYLAAADVELVTDGIVDHAISDIRKEFEK